MPSELVRLGGRWELQLSQQVDAYLLNHLHTCAPCAGKWCEISNGGLVSSTRQSPEHPGQQVEALLFWALNASARC